jgi:hypothetical protein
VRFVNAPVDDSLTVPGVDTAKPIVTFDPWPFEKESLVVPNAYLYAWGELVGDEQDSWHLQSGHENTLAVATDGRYVVMTAESAKQFRS